MWLCRGEILSLVYIKQFHRYHRFIWNMLYLLCSWHYPQQPPAVIISVRGRGVGVHFRVTVIAEGSISSFSSLVFEMWHFPLNKCQWPEECSMFRAASKCAFPHLQTL